MNSQNFQSDLKFSRLEIADVPTPLLSGQTATQLNSLIGRSHLILNPAEQELKRL
jgi:hypothetical protein